MVMTDNSDDDAILDLAVSALPSLSRHCRAEAVWLDGAWQSVECLRGRVGPRAGLEAELANLGAAGGAVRLRDPGWAWAFPLSSRGAPGFLVVGAPEQPPDHERSLISALAHQTGVALANARLLARERATRARFADEQATLRRVATLVARAAPPEEVFAAVAAEAGRLLDADFAVMSRYDEHGTATVVGTWSASPGPQPLPPGTRLEPEHGGVHAVVFATDRPARIEDYGGSPGVGANIARQWGVRATVGVPIHIEGRLWGIIGVASRREQSLPVGTTETWLAGFAELVAAAIANAEAQAALTASRARIVAAGDTARHRIERDLHDGAQQQLVSLALRIRAAQAAVPPDAGELSAELERLAEGLAAALDELHEIARGIHPAALAKGGLVPALTGLARRSAVPVRLDVHIDARLPEQIELAAYYVVAEALTNAAKHADADRVDVEVVAGADVVHVCVRDDGRGGADVSRGSGLLGLKDRVEALGGRISLHSPAGAGTSVDIALPITR